MQFVVLLWLVNEAPAWLLYFTTLILVAVMINVTTCWIAKRITRIAELKVTAIPVGATESLLFLYVATTASLLVPRTRH